MFDKVLDVLRSRDWRANTAMFVRSHCVLFDSDCDEFQHGQFEVFGEYQKLIEQLLLVNLSVQGVSQEVFFDACEKGLVKRIPQIEHIVELMAAYADFRCFVDIMSAENKKRKKGIDR